jgi:predicted PhzF superfamily epimerase YddE/YHI9
LCGVPGTGEDCRVAIYHLLNVFTAEDGSHGNPLAVFLDGSALPDPAERQRIASDLGYSETVFVDDMADGTLHIFTPASELPLAGHPLVGSAWLIEHEQGWCDVLNPPAGEVATWSEDDIRWIRANPAPSSVVELRQYDSPQEVEALTGPPDGLGFVSCWSWIDEAAGTLRSRVFVLDEGIPEDEATGLAALRMGVALGRDEFLIRQGKGSLLAVRKGPDDTIEVGGRVRYVSEHVYG